MHRHVDLSWQAAVRVYPTTFAPVRRVDRAVAEDDAITMQELCGFRGLGLWGLVFRLLPAAFSRYRFLSPCSDV